MGKGLSGGKLIGCPPRQSTFVPEENILIGNVALYGATGGEAYFRGGAGERFGVRNSGAHKVVEGVGDHGCDYMTGGRVVLIGSTGRNFAAGMSGGVAYVLDAAGDFKRHCNLAMVEIDPLASGEDGDLVKELLKRHMHLSGTAVAQNILARWKTMQPKFVKVTPKDYKRVLAAISKARQTGIPEEQAV